MHERLACGLMYGNKAIRSLASAVNMSSEKKRFLPQSLVPAYGFYGSNSSHSAEHGTGGRTYHVPNYATSYANDRTKLINVKFDEGRGNHRITMALVIAFLLISAVPLSTAATWSQYFI